MSKGAFSSVSGDDFNALELTVRQVCDNLPHVTET